MDFNAGWLFSREGETEKVKVDLPHDAMMLEGRDFDNPGGVNVSFFGGGKYIYEKDFDLDLKEGEVVYIEFEGIYKEAQIYLNDQKAYEEFYGYNTFIFDATPYVNRSGKNHIRVIADNSMQPNSRWYTGSGIYRPVHLYILPKVHIVPNSIRAETKDYKRGEISLSAKFTAPSSYRLTITDIEDKVVYEENGEETKEISKIIVIEDPRLWSEEHPYLYRVKIEIEGQSESVRFGVRQLELNKEKGFLLNGERILLLGACIHHDNGILGARTYTFSERRKVELLKKAGYNSLRMAHNPCSKALLDACDELGVYILDEYVDCWYIHKTKHDYSSEVEKRYKEDLKMMVEKDFSHPSVIMYSIGNEVSETESKRGVEFTKMLVDQLHEYDPTRPVTCGVNISFNAFYHLGFGQYTDKKAAQNKKPKKKSVGSEFFNKLANAVGAAWMQGVARTPLCDRVTRDSFAMMDIAGYNYARSRYKVDLKKYPDRFILGSETFCHDAGKFYNFAVDHPRILGDFVWAGMDYLGESGVGSWVSLEDKSVKTDKASWMTAGSGRIDILGDENCEMAYTRTAWKKEVIAMGIVSPKDHRLGHTPSAWKFSQALASYSFHGEEGEKTQCEVYTMAPYAEVYQNGKLIKRLKRKNDKGFYKFKIKYIPGTIEAIAYDEDHKRIGSCQFKTGKESLKLTVVPELETLKKEDLLYVHLYITDEDGEIRPLEDRVVKVASVKGGELLAIGNGCPFNREGFDKGEAKTYYGKALAIFKPNGEDQIDVTFNSDIGEGNIKISVIE